MKIHIKCDFNINKNQAKRIIQEVNRLVETGGSSVEAQAKVAVPVDTGLLRSSINSVFKKSNTKPSFVVQTDVEYAPYVEYGTWKMSARPYLTPAFYGEAERIHQKLLAIMRRYG